MENTFPIPPLGDGPEPEELVTDLEVREEVVRLLRLSKAPLTFGEIRDQFSLAWVVTAERLDKLLAELLADGRVFECSPKEDGPRYWVHDEHHMARDKVLELVAQRPRKQTEIESELGKSLPGRPGRPWCRNVIDSMIGSGELHRHPPARGSVYLLATEPPDPADLLSPSLVKQLQSAWKKLQGVGVSVEAFLAAVQGRVAPETVAAEEPAPPKADTAAKPAPERRPMAKSLWEVELEDLLLKGMHDVEPDADQGWLVPITSLRAQMPREYQTKDTFDRVVLSLAGAGKLNLHLREEADPPTEADWRLLVPAEGGRFYAYVSKPPGQP